MLKRKCFHRFNLSLYVEKYSKNNVSKYRFCKIEKFIQNRVYIPHIRLYRLIMCKYVQNVHSRALYWLAFY